MGEDRLNVQSQGPPHVYGDNRMKNVKVKNVYFEGLLLTILH